MKFFCLFFVVCLTQVYCAEQPLQLPANLQEFFAQSEANWNKAVDHVKNMVGLTESKNAKEVLDTMKTRVTEMTNNLQASVTSLQEQVKTNPEVQKWSTQIQEKVNATLAELKAANPEVAANAENMSDKVAHAYKTLLREMKKIESEATKAGGLKDNVDAMVKSVVDQSTEQLQELEKSLHKVTGHEAH